MDALARLHGEAGPLLARVDATLEQCGAPPEHDVWPLLRRRGLLPADAVANVAAWTVPPLRERAALMRNHIDRCSQLDGLLSSVPAEWEGRAGAAFAARWQAASREQEVLRRNAEALAGHLDELADWVARGRARVAHTLATVMRSAQAVTLKTSAGPVPVTAAVRAQAAADIGAEVLAEIDLFWLGALDLSHSWSTRLSAGAEARATVHTPVATVSATAAVRVDL